MLIYLRVVLYETVTRTSQLIVVASSGCLADCVSASASGVPDSNHTLASLHGCVPCPGDRGLDRSGGRCSWCGTGGNRSDSCALLITCQNWSADEPIAFDESLFSHDLWMALDRTRTCSHPILRMVDRQFLEGSRSRHRPPAHGGMTLSRPVTRGTYLFATAGPSRR